MKGGILQSGFVYLAVDNLTLMAFFPYERFVIISNLPPRDIEQKLASSIGRYEFKLFNNHNELSKPYNGHINWGTFQITRNIQYRNSFLPQITGSIKQDVTSGSTIAVTMKLHLVVIIFMCFWLGATGIGGLALIITSLFNGDFHPAMFMVFGMFAFGYCLATFAFKYESKISREFLLELTQGYIQQK